MGSRRSAVLLVVVVCAVCRVVSGCSRCKEKSLPFDERSPDAVYASLLVGPQDLDASEAEGGSAPRVYHPDVLPVPSTRCPRIGGTLEIRFSETVDRPVATAYWRKPGTGQDGTGEGDAVFEAIVSEFGQDYIYEQASTCVGYGVLPRDTPATGPQTLSRGTGGRRSPRSRGCPRGSTRGRACRTSSMASPRCATRWSGWSSPTATGATWCWLTPPRVRPRLPPTPRR